MNPSQLQIAIKAGDIVEVDRILEDIINSNQNYQKGQIGQYYERIAMMTAAKHDVINGTKITQLLLEKYKANPNLQDNTGSIPIYQALAEARRQGQKHLGVVKYLIQSPAFQIHKSNPSRGSPIEFISKYLTEGQDIDVQELIRKRIWQNKKPSIFLWSSIFRTLE